MPELPDVENVTHRIRPHLVGAAVEAAVVLDPSVLVNTTHEALDETLSEQVINKVRRRGKFIVIETGHYALLVHLRMTGNLVLAEPSAVPRYTRLLLQLDTGEALAFIDPRRFGKVYLLSLRDVSRLPPISELGPEPLEISREEFRKLIRSRKGMIKALLLDQRFIVGIGNLYADEILWRSGIAPSRKAPSLSDEEIDLMYDAMRDSLSTAHGIFFPHRTEPGCIECNTPLVRSVVGGRTTYHCPKCQSA